MIELAIMLKKCLAIITALYNLFMYKSRRLLLQKGDFFFDTENSINEHCKNNTVLLLFSLQRY